MVKVRIGHVEVPSPEPSRAAEFFRRAFGWRAEPVAWEGAPYFKLRSTVEPQGIESGLLAAEEAGFRHPLPVLHLEEGSIEDCLEEIVAAGGEISAAPGPVGSFGVFARFRDPDGHEWGLWTDRDRPR